MVGVSGFSSSLIRKKKKWKVLNSVRRGGSEHTCRREYAGVCGSMSGWAQRDEAGGAREFLTKESFIYLHYEETPQTVKQVLCWLLGLSSLLVCFYFSQVKACAATLWFTVVVLYFLKHDGFPVKEHVSHGFYSLKCYCYCSAVVPNSPCSCS